MYKDKYEFPAIIINHGDEFEIKIYDFEGVSIYEDNLEGCYVGIQEALEAEIYKYIEWKKEIPEPTPIEEIELGYNQTVFTIKIDTEYAIRKSKKLGVIVAK